MAIIEFPPVDIADEQGLLAIGGDLHHDSLLLAYKSGIFPWPISEEYPLAWFSPPLRGIIKKENISLSKSTRKFLKNCDWKITFNKDFFAIITHCQETHLKSQDGTWITDEIISGYTNFFNKEMAYSVEVRDEQNEIIGGLYGVNIGHFLSGESMFYMKPYASKVALLAVLSIVKKFDIPYLDTQMVTPVTESFGATEINRIDFINTLKELMNKKPIDFPEEMKARDLLSLF